MIKTSEKLIFLLVVIVAAFFARTLYPSISVSPQNAVADGSATMAGGNVSQPPLVALPPISAINSENSIGQVATATATTSISNIKSVFSQVGSAPIPSFNKKEYMVADLTTGAVLSDTNTAARWPTASLTKFMTATVILDNLATSTQITITPQMFAADPDEATIVVGDTYTVEDLLHLMLMPSSNVAAEAMADFIGRARFMQEMNTRAQQWGMQNTYFDDPSGISAANQSSANDMLILAQHVYNNYPEILAITRTHQTTVTEINTGRKVLVTSINDFAGEAEFIGGKTGHTAQAGGNLLSIFNYHDHPVFIVVLDTADRFGDTAKLFTWFKNNFI